MSNSRLTLGDAGASNDDVSYAGPSSGVSLDYFRAKAREFQETLNALDVAYQAANAVYSMTDPPDEELYSLLIDYETRAATLKATASAINLGAEAVNAMGGRMPVLSIPSTLGLPPLVLPAAALAAVAAVSGIVAWKIAFVAGVERGIERAMQSVNANVTDPAQRAAVQADLSAELAKVREANRLTIGSPFEMLGQNFGGVLKLAIVVGLGYLAWRSMGDVIDRQ